MRKMMTALAMAIGLTTAATGASAAGIGFDLRPATPGGSQQVYELDNGNFLGLWGISGGAQAVLAVTLNTADLVDDFGVNKQSIVGFYYGAPVLGGAWAGDPAEFTAFGDTFEIAATSNNSDKLFDSIWVEWTGGNLFNLAQNSNMAAVATIDGDPLAPVPVPAALPLLLAGLGGMAFVARRRKAA